METFVAHTHAHTHRHRHGHKTHAHAHLILLHDLLSKSGKSIFNAINM